MRLILGFALAFAIGAVCCLARIPSPAPNEEFLASTCVSQTRYLALHIAMPDMPVLDAERVRHVA
jgi:hypothetical protein